MDRARERLVVVEGELSESTAVTVCFQGRRGGTEEWTWARTSLDGRLGSWMSSKCVLCIGSWNTMDGPLLQTKIER